MHTFILAQRQKISRLIAMAVPVILGACSSVPPPGQIYSRVDPPPWGTSATRDRDVRRCNEIAKGSLQVYVQCLQQRGDHVELYNPNGSPVNSSALNQSA